ncbi:MAG TPA: nucleotidyl transferase AbiEii/AbiGii toxin family protein, partial [Dermatophilaceae bacterium]
ELVATKIRALYQRRKGRDLYDMWLALTDPSLALTGQNLLAAFDPYRPNGLTAKLTITSGTATFAPTRTTSSPAAQPATTSKWPRS